MEISKEPASANVSKPKATTKSRSSSSKRKRQAAPSSPAKETLVSSPKSKSDAPSSANTSMEQDGSTTITITGNNDAVEIVTMHDEVGNLPPTCKEETEPETEPKPKRLRTDKAKLNVDNGECITPKCDKTSHITCDTNHPGRIHVVLSDESPVKIKTEPNLSSGSSGGKNEVARFYTCVDHATYLGSFGACTLVVANTPQDAQDTLDEWLARNSLKTRVLHPYRLAEIVPRKRGVILVNIPSHYEDGIGDVKNTSIAEDNIEMRFEDLQLFVYKDVEKCAPTLCGAVMFAMSANDAVSMLNAELKACDLLSFNNKITKDNIQQESTSFLGSRGKVIPLSVYMVDTTNE